MFLYIIIISLQLTAICGKSGRLQTGLIARLFVSRGEKARQAEQEAQVERELLVQQSEEPLDLDQMTDKEFLQSGVVPAKAKFQLIKNLLKTI